MNKEQFKAQHPELYEEIRKEAVTDERSRVAQHVELGAQSGAKEMALAAVLSGEAVTLAIMQKHMAFAMSRRASDAFQADSDAAGSAVEGAAIAGATAAVDGDLGDKVVAEMERRRYGTPLSEQERIALRHRARSSASIT